MIIKIKIIISFYLCCCWGQGFAAPSYGPINLNDQASLQRGAALFMNYCSGCHSLKYVQYEQMGHDLGISSKLLKNNLIFTQSKSSDSIEIALPPNDAQQWFGLVPPDLSLIARQKGPVWLYGYLTGFYQDKSRPLGVNNILVPNVAMPDVLESLKGTAYLLTDPAMHQSVLKITQSGEIPAQQFEQIMVDLITFLVYVSEPNHLSRIHLGPYVILFLIILLLPVYYLKVIYWRTI
jgi:ubiquinol-cytochrome c reductase cytochrome c1 subunit